MSSESPEHEGIVLDILRIQEMGPLTRPASGVNGIDIVRTVDGTLWNDLPFLVGDMTDFWVKYGASMSGTHCHNFGTFLAKLASTRVAKDRPCQVALLIFRALFENPQALHTGDESDEEDLNRGTNQLEVFHLLPAAPHQQGRGVLESQLKQRSLDGFSQWRYMFWLKRLHEIQEEAKEADERALEKLAADGIQ